MRAVPVSTPVTRPVEALTEATDVRELLQEPPDEESVSAIVSERHSASAPEIVAGTGLTVMTLTERQPVEDSV